MSKLVAVGNHVVLKQVEAEETTKSGIILTSGAQEKPQEAVVVAVGAGKKDGPTAFFPIGVDHFLKAGYILNLVYKQIVQPWRFWKPGQKDVKLVGSFDLSVFPGIQIQKPDVIFTDALCPKLICGQYHQAGFSAAPDACEHFDNIIRVVKASNHFQILLALKQFHWKTPLNFFPIIPCTARKSQVVNTVFADILKFESTTNIPRKKVSSGRQSMEVLEKIGLAFFTEIKYNIENNKEKRSEQHC